ncbi:MAG TPA: protein kinase [Pyrinomonadaceae bacterium]|jgi:Tol biopolymer transport system component/predicted Ser/Thr protein kinase
MSLDPGTRLGRYEIRSKIGAGGMGEVYLALDTQLDREVALKILAPEIARDQQRLHRFLQEARAASKLKGPHAAHIYDVGESGGAHFIAMEHVEGESLDRLIGGRPMATGEVIRLGAQIAEALEEAHSRSVTHRDVKPQNVIVTPKGQAKVLDFGLAKVTGDAAADAEAATRVKTSPGVVMGTVAYMSPEQALGERDIDHRTDLYSLGVVLYEMATGRVPFAAESVSKTIDKIVHEQPEAMARFNYDVPAALDLVVRKALRKRRDERYQTAHDLLVDLRALQDELGFTAQQQQQHRSLAPGAPAAQTIATNTAAGGEQATLMLDSTEARQRTTAFAGAETQPAVASSESRRRRSPAVVAAAVVALVALASLAGYAAYRLWSVHGHAEAERAPFSSLQDMRITKLPSPGLIGTAAISPDGKFIARTVYEGGKISLRLRQVASTGEKEIVPAFDGYIHSLLFARDGNSIYYAAQTVPNMPPDLRHVSILGGDSQKLVAGMEGWATLSPDGTRLAFVRYDPKTKGYSIVVADAGGGGERVLAARNPPLILKHVAWSPDGKLVACVVSGTDKEGYYTNVEGFSVADGSSRPISSARWRVISSIAWMPDGSGLLLAGRDRASLPSTPEQVWFVNYPDGASRRVTNDTNYYVVVSITADARTLLAGTHGESSQIWVAPGGDSARARQITSAAGDSIYGLSWTPDGRILFDSVASGNTDIWSINADGSAPRQLTFDQLSDIYPAAAPDGRYVAFLTNRSVGWSLWRMNADGSNARELVRNVNQEVPVCSPDSRWVFYKGRDEAGKLAVWKVSIDGGEPVRAWDRELYWLAVSPDGRWLAGFYTEPEPGAPVKIVVVPVGGGEPARVFDVTKDTDGPLVWSPDGRALEYAVVTAGIENVWRQPLAGGKPTQLTKWADDAVGVFAWSRDGKQLAVVRGTTATDLLLMQNSR